MEKLSKRQARRLVSRAQGLPPNARQGSAEHASLSALEDLGYVQIDTISVIQRAHHHVLWSRNPRYSESHLDALLAEKRVFEYWAHAAAYLPMRDFRFTLPRKNALARGERTHWFRRDEKMMAYVLDRIRGEGPLMARDFEGPRRKPGGWGAKPAKQALENLFMQGDLMIPRREKFQKVYDLAERVLLSGLDATEPTREEYARFLITRYLAANGVGRPSEIAYLLKNTKPLVERVSREMLEAGDLVEIDVEGDVYLTRAEGLERMTRSEPREKLQILSPFDNLLIQRKRVRELFDFDYQLECYVPAAKRKHGYFVLPVLWGDRFVARMDCKADRQRGCLRVLSLSLESDVEASDALFNALETEIATFASFNGCEEKSPRNLRGLI